MVVSLWAEKRRTRLKLMREREREGGRERGHPHVVVSLWAEKRRMTVKLENQRLRGEEESGHPCVVVITIEEMLCYI